MFGRVIPPAWSPVSLGTVASALRGLASGQRAVRDAETAVARLLGAVAARGTDSGTTALRLAVELAGRRKPGAAVALPGYGCFDLATALDGAGLPVVLYDLDPVTLGPDWGSFERALQRGVSAAVVAHWYGFPADAARAGTLTRAAGAWLIEDAAQAAGAALAGRPLGGEGDFSVLSFGRGKGLTGGGGGAVAARSAEAAALLADLPPLTSRLGLRSGAVLTALLLASRPPLYSVVASLPGLRLGETPYHRPHRPEGLSAVSAGAVGQALGMSQPARRDRAARARRLIDRIGRIAAASLPVVLPGAEPGYLRLPILLADRTQPVREARRLGVMPGYPQALVDLDGFRDRVVNRDEAFPGSRRLAAELVTLPTHRWVSDRDLAALESWLDRVLSRRMA